MALVYLTGVLTAFILYRIGRYLEFKYKDKVKNFTSTTYGAILVFYIAILCSWMGAALMAAIIGIMLSEVLKDKTPPKWL